MRKGALAVVLSMVLFGGVFIHPAQGEKYPTQTIADLWKGLEWQKVAYVLLSLLLYPLVLPLLGYLITTFGLMAFLFGITGQTRTWVRGVNALIVTLASVLLFHRLLDVNLPKGMFGF